MQQFHVALGDTIDRTGVDYGSWNADDAPSALLAALHDADPTREHETPVLLSESDDYGRGAPRDGYDGAGNGAQDRSGWFYVSDETDHVVGVYTVAEVACG